MMFSVYCSVCDHDLGMFPEEDEAIEVSAEHRDHEHNPWENQMVIDMDDWEDKYTPGVTDEPDWDPCPMCRAPVDLSERVPYTCASCKTVFVPKE
jgi:hypothetical protein